MTVFSKYASGLLLSTTTRERYKYMRRELFMSKVVVFTNLTLDGVMQAPGRPDEDRRGGFEHGGWATPYAAMAQAGNSMSSTGAMLLGRRTYEDFYAFWPNQSINLYTDMLNNYQ